MNTERSSLLLKRPMYSCEENMHEHITYVHLCIYVHTICVHPEPVSLGTGCSVNIVFFSLKYCDFSELCQFCCSAGVLPAWFEYIH